MPIIRFTNCRVCRDGRLISNEDIFFDDTTGKIINSQKAFYNDCHAPDTVIDLANHIVAPGFIELQINGGANGFDYSVFNNEKDYKHGVSLCRKQLLSFGVTSFLPTIISSTASLYSQVLPHLQPTLGTDDGADILGVHAEGPFISVDKPGCHPKETFQEPREGFDSLASVYGEEYLCPNGTIKIITGAPELEGMSNVITECKKRGIVFSIGHSNAGIQEAEYAVRRGAGLITHLFNAMPPLHHRDPGIVGLLGAAEDLPRPYYGLICDDIHIHHSSVKVAYRAHRDGAILVSDAMAFVDCPNGTYSWRNELNVVKKGYRLVIEGSDVIAGSAVPLDACVRNLVNWTAANLPEAINCVTKHPALLLGISDRKGMIAQGCDADFVVLDDYGFVLQTWKNGKLVFDKKSKTILNDIYSTPKLGSPLLSGNGFVD